VSSDDLPWRNGDLLTDGPVEVKSEEKEVDKKADKTKGKKGKKDAPAVEEAPKVVDVAPTTCVLDLAVPASKALRDAVRFGGLKVSVLRGGGKTAAPDDAPPEDQPREALNLVASVMIPIRAILEPLPSNRNMAMHERAVLISQSGNGVKPQKDSEGQSKVPEVKLSIELNADESIAALLIPIDPSGADKQESPPE